MMNIVSFDVEILSGELATKFVIMVHLLYAFNDDSILFEVDPSTFNIAPSFTDTDIQTNRFSSLTLDPSHMPWFHNSNLVQNISTCFLLP
jgi:hypothetical protein